MDLSTEIRYPGARVDDVAAMLLDERFRAAVCDATMAISHEVQVRLGADGSAEVAVSRTLPAEVPDFVKRFVGQTIELTQSESWAAADGSSVRSADLTLAVVGKPATMTGTIVLEEDPDGVRELVRGKLKVAVPFLGGKIENEIAKAIEAAARAEEETGRAWLAS